MFQKIQNILMTLQFSYLIRVKNVTSYSGSFFNSLSFIYFLFLPNKINDQQHHNLYIIQQHIGDMVHVLILKTPS